MKQKYEEEFTQHEKSAENMRELLIQTEEREQKKLFCIRRNGYKTKQ